MDDAPATDLTGRAMAPGALALVQAFVNTADLAGGHDELTDQAQLVAWLVARGLIESDAAVDETVVRRVIEVREAIRALLVGNAGGTIGPEATAILSRAATAARLTIAFDDAQHASLVPMSGGIDEALGHLLAIVYAAMVDGSWVRLKACRAESCRWTFYDASKNRSGIWCSMAICGNRQKTRTYRARRAVTETRTGSESNRSEPQ